MSGKRRVPTATKEEYVHSIQEALVAIVKLPDSEELRRLLMEVDDLIWGYEDL